MPLLAWLRGGPELKPRRPTEAETQGAAPAPYMRPWATATLGSGMVAPPRRGSALPALPPIQTESASLLLQGLSFLAGARGPSRTARQK